jgi:hypothetical membrane protein
MTNRKIIVLTGAAACFTGCTGDFLSLYILGAKYPGYSHLADPVSFLGSSASPVSHLISVFWIILGVLMILFAIGFRTAYSSDDRYVKIAFWLLILYGLGEGMGSGLFKADQVNNSYTLSFIIHDILGGAGVTAILLLTLILPKIEELSSNRNFVIFSRIILILGILLLILFTQRFIGSKNAVSHEIARYTGLWQRLLILDYYIYLIFIAFKMVKKTI